MREYEQKLENKTFTTSVQEEQEMLISYYWLKLPQKRIYSRNFRDDTPDHLALHEIDFILSQRNFIPSVKQYTGNNIQIDQNHL